MASSLSWPGSGRKKRRSASLARRSALRRRPAERHQRHSFLYGTRRRLRPAAARLPHAARHIPLPLPAETVFGHTPALEHTVCPRLEFAQPQERPSGAGADPARQMRSRACEPSARRRESGPAIYSAGASPRGYRRACKQHMPACDTRRVDQQPHLRGIRRQLPSATEVLNYLSQKNVCANQSTAQTFFCMYLAYLKALSRCWRASASPSASLPPAWANPGWPPPPPFIFLAASRTSAEAL